MGHLNERLLETYRVLPWCLAALLNDKVSMERKRRLAQWFVDLKPCCLDKAFGIPFRKTLECVDDLLPGGQLQSHLQACFHGPNCNIEIECNFARLQSMKRCGRGKSDLFPSLSAKHYLAEIKGVHLKHVKLLNDCSSGCGKNRRPFLRRCLALNKGSISNWKFGWITLILVLL